MPFTGICLNTPDVLALARFYSAVFDAPVNGDATHCELALPGLALAIFSTAGMETMAPGYAQNPGGTVTLMFQVQDVDAECERVRGLGAQVILPPTTHPWGARSFWFRDPDGNIIDFYAPLPG